MIHQATELWLKLMVHELRAARQQIIADDLQPAFKMLARVSRIQAQLIQSWDVLSTLTPADYLAFRHRLGPASGLQSHQYRLLEFVLGRSSGMLAVHRHTPAIQAELRRELEAPSLYDEAIRLLARRGFRDRAGGAQRDWSGRTGAIRACSPPGRRSTGNRGRTGTCTNSPRSWSTWRTGSGSGAFAT